jgi:hypothetical protein
MSLVQSKAMVKQFNETSTYGANLVKLFKYLGYRDLCINAQDGEDEAKAEPGDGRRYEHLRIGVRSALRTFGIKTYDDLVKGHPIILCINSLGKYVPAACLMDIISAVGYAITHDEIRSKELDVVARSDSATAFASTAERATFHRKFGSTVIAGKVAKEPTVKITLKELPDFSGEVADWALWKDQALAVLLQCGLHLVVKSAVYSAAHENHSTIVYGMILAVFNKASCKGDYVCVIDESSTMSGYVLWGRLEKTYESKPILKLVHKGMHLALSKLQCTKEVDFIPFVRKFMRLRKSCDAYQVTIAKHKVTLLTWNMPLNDMEWKESFIGKVNIPNMQGCRNRCEQSKTHGLLDTICEFQGDIFEFHPESAKSFTDAEAQLREPRMRGGKVNPNKETSNNATSSVQNNSSSKSEDKHYGQAMSELHNTCSSLAKADADKVRASIKKLQQVRKRRHSAASADGKPKGRNKSQRRTKAKAAAGGNVDNIEETTGMESDPDQH